MSDKEPGAENGVKLGRTLVHFAFYALVIYAVLYIIGLAMDAPPEQSNRVLDLLPPLRFQ